MNEEVRVRRVLEISGQKESVETQLRFSLRDGKHDLPGRLILQVRTVYSEVSTVAEMDPFTRGHFSCYEEPPLDFTRQDKYQDGEIPNADYMTALKVLRTVRETCLIQGNKNGDAAILRYALDTLRRVALTPPTGEDNAAGNEAEATASDYASSKADSTPIDENSGYTE